MVLRLCHLRSVKVGKTRLKVFVTSLVKLRPSNASPPSSHFKTCRSVKVFATPSTPTTLRPLTSPSSQKTLRKKSAKCMLFWTMLAFSK